MSRLDEIKARADAATEGPWVRDMHSPDMGGRSGENSQRPSEPVLPRRIKPEDVRVGMLVERRRGESHVGGRVKHINDSGIGLDGGAVAWIFGGMSAARGWSLWLVEDAPAPVDPDAEALGQMAQAMANRDGSDDAIEWVPWAEVALDALRKTHDVTARAEQ